MISRKAMRGSVASLGFVISAACIWWMVSRVDWRVVFNRMEQVGLLHWCLGSAIYVISFLPRTLRWQLMLRPAAPVPLREAGGGLLIGFAANNLLPFRMGEFVRAGIVARRCGISNWTCLASIFAERVLDGFCVVLTLLVSLHLLRSYQSGPLVNWLIWGATSIFIIAALAMVFCVCYEKQLEHLAKRFLPSWLAKVPSKITEAFHFLRHSRVIVPTTILSLLIWVTEAAVFCYYLRLLGFQEPIARGLFCLAFVNLTILIPSAPGYVGVFEVGAAGAFAAMGLHQADGVTLSLLVHPAQFIPITLIGMFLASWFGIQWSASLQTRTFNDDAKSRN